jgi:hypothetical protein
MTAYRFVHAADVHLDSPLRSLALRDPRLAEFVGNASRQVFSRIVDVCLDEQVSALLLAGGPGKPARQIPAAVAGAINIGLMHTSLDGSPPPDVYAPWSTADLLASRFRRSGTSTNVQRRKAPVPS